ncbi:MAG: hypothetical protein KF878_12830 [Planctomycetes bacterium]|nr:hypothetical protein [Planctomycetota bacterium]
MSDTKLRDLERRWRETGSPDDEAAYLLERVRVGDLTQERLELAAYCGHEGARRGLGISAPPPTGAEKWIQCLTARFGAAVGLRALLLLLRRVPHNGPPALVQEARELLDDGIRALDESAAAPDLGHGADELRYQAWDLPNGTFKDWVGAVARAALAVNQFVAQDWGVKGDPGLSLLSVKVPAKARTDVISWAISRRVP